MRTFEQMVKAKDSGWQPIPGGKRGGQRKKVGGKWTYRYPDQAPKKTGTFAKLFGGVKKLFGKKPTPSSREKLETLASDKGMLSSIAKLTDLSTLMGLRDMLLAHGAEEKKPRAAAEPREPVESEDNFDTMPEADPEPKERKERKTNPLNKLLALVNKRIGQLEAEKPEKKDTMTSAAEIDALPDNVTDSIKYAISDTKKSIIRDGGILHADIGNGLGSSTPIRVSVATTKDQIKSRVASVIDKLGDTPAVLASMKTYLDAFKDFKGGVIDHGGSKVTFTVDDLMPSKSEDNFDTMPESNAQGTQSTKDADAAHPEDRHEEVPDRKTRGLGEHNDKLSNIILDGKPLSDDTEFLDHLEVDDYPYGRDRTTAKFTIETDKRGRQRAVMQTVNPRTGRENKPKKATYTGSVKFFMHEGKTYVLEHSAEYGMVSISKVAGGFRNAMFETPDAPRPTNNVSPNMGGRYDSESNEHPAGYSSLYEAATGKPAPKVQDFKDARKRIEDRREASIQRMQETNDRKAAVGLGISASSSELEAREKAIAEGKASMVDGKYVEKPKSPAAQALEFVESNKPENRTKTAKDTVMKFLTENRRNQTAMVSLLGAYDDGGGYDLQLKQAKTGTLTAIVTRPDGSQSAKKLPKAISATAPQDIHKIALEHLSTVTEADNKKAATQAKDIAAAVAKFKAAASGSSAEVGFTSSLDKHFSDRQAVEIQKAPSGHGKGAVSNKVQKYLETFTSKDDLRPNLRYVYHGDGESVATDGHRMVIVPTDKKLDESAKTLHPYQASKGLMIPNAKVRKEEFAEGFGNSQDHKEYNENRAESMSFFKYTQIKSSKTVAHYADVKKLTAALDLAIANGKAGGATYGVRLTVSDSGELSVRIDPTLSDGKSVTGRREDIPTEMSLGNKAPGQGKAKDHFINAKYLKAALKNAGDGVVEIGLGTRELSPITVEHTNGVKHFIMPLRNG